MSLMTVYNTLSYKLSRNQYTPLLAALELISLAITYVSGMAIAVFKLPLIGAVITAHIYAAAFTVIFALAIYGSSTRANNLPLRVLAILNILSVIGAAFMGLFFFGGFVEPIYALGMGIGFVFTVVFTSAILFYGMKERSNRITPAMIASIAETLILVVAFTTGTLTLLYVGFPITESWEAGFLSLHTSFGLLAGLGAALLFAIGYLGNNKTLYRLGLITAIFVGIAAAGGLAFYIGYYYTYSYVMALALLVAIVSSTGYVIESM